MIALTMTSAPDTRRGGPGGRAGARRAMPVMADVARAAGVSEMTVSRVLNGSPSVRPATRDRVLDAMREFDYRPNPAARALVTGRSSTVGVVSMDSTLFGPASTLFGLEQAAHAAGYVVTVASVRDLTRESIAGAVDRLHRQGVEGVLVIAPHVAAQTALRQVPKTLPLVVVEAGTGGGFPVVAVDQAAGARLATEHLLGLGHRTVWHLAGPSDWLEAQARERAWQAALEAAGAPVPPVLRGDWSARSGYELGRELAERDGVSAVFAANDPMALGLLRALDEAGRTVPDDISVVGFDDMPEAEFFIPPLTTIRQDFDEVGKRGMALLLAQMTDAPAEGGQTDNTRRSARGRRASIKPALVLRSSTAPARG
jgi:DNA-binding LacI/PurR family transcriptional regulator